MLYLRQLGVPIALKYIGWDIPSTPDPYNDGVGKQTIHPKAVNLPAKSIESQAVLAKHYKDYRAG